MALVLMFIVLLYIIFIRSYLFKILIILEVLFIPILVFGCLINPLTSNFLHIVFIFCLIAIVGCEAVFGLAFLILRTRINLTEFKFKYSSIVLRK
jgi:hypothetical protein